MSNGYTQHGGAGYASHIDSSGYPLDETHFSDNYIYDNPQPLQSFSPYPPAYPPAYEQQQGRILDSLDYNVDPQTDSYVHTALHPQQTQLPAFHMNEAWACNTQQPLGFLQDQAFPAVPSTAYDKPDSRHPQMPTTSGSYSAYNPRQMSYISAQPPYTGYGLNVSEQPFNWGDDLPANAHSVSGQGENDALSAADLGVPAGTNTYNSRESEMGQGRVEVSSSSRTPKTRTTNQSQYRRARRKRVYELFEQLDPKAVIDSSCGVALNTASEQTTKLLQCYVQQLASEVDRFERGAVLASYEGEPECSLGIPVLVWSRDLEGRGSLELVREGMDAHMVVRNRKPFRWRGLGSTEGATVTGTVKRQRAYRDRESVCRWTARHLVSLIDSRVFLDRSCKVLVHTGSADTRRRLERIEAELIGEIDRFERGAFKRDDYTGEPENSPGVPVLDSGKHRQGYKMLELVREPMAKVLERKPWLRELHPRTKDIVE